MYATRARDTHHVIVAQEGVITSVCWCETFVSEPEMPLAYNSTYACLYYVCVCACLHDCWSLFCSLFSFSSMFSLFFWRLLSFFFSCVRINFARMTRTDHVSTVVAMRAQNLR